MSSVDFRELQSAYRLGWCVKMGRSGSATVLHGPWVDTFSDGLVEGAWTGLFPEKGFPEADIFLGTGVRDLTSARLFVTASHPYDPLYSVRDGDGLLVANSLPFLCAAGEYCSDVGYPYYLHDLSSFTRGLSRSATSVPLKDGGELRVHRCRLIEVSSDLKMKIQRRPPLPKVESYTEYKAFLTESAGRIAQNASAAGREHQFSPLATISSGYDSPAAAVFAREAGANRAVTFGSARRVFGRESDAGGEIGRCLGLQVKEHSRLGYRKRDDFPEVDFLAAGTGGEDVVFASLEEEVSGTVLFTGFAGDSLWARHHPDPKRSLDFATGDRSGSSLTEFRLRTGFVHFPVPLATYTQHPSLHRISNSREMEPWSIGDRRSFSPEVLLGRKGPGYDRPIPRRIVEEEGVPRDLFGQQKRAVSQPFYHDEDLDEIMSTRSLEEFRSFLRRFDLPPGGIEETVHRITSALYRVLQVPFKVTRRLAVYLGEPIDITLPWPDRYKEPLSENLYTFHWALETVRRRYTDALRQQAEKPRE